MDKVNEKERNKPVDSVRVALVDDDLRSKVLGSTAHCPRLVLHALGESEVRDAHVPAMVNEHVLGLQVTEHNINVVEKIESKDSFS
jgi:hypothetical protein